MLRLDKYSRLVTRRKRPCQPRGRRAVLSFFTVTVVKTKTMMGSRMEKKHVARVEIQPATRQPLHEG